MVSLNAVSVSVSLATSPSAVALLGQVSMITAFRFLLAIVFLNLPLTCILNIFMSLHLIYLHWRVPSSTETSFHLFVCMQIWQIFTVCAISGLVEYWLHDEVSASIGEQTAVVHRNAVSSLV